ncbi:DUF1501 domain-containing protein [Chitinibacter sp. SCUT-21]|uniref:DUF1501 domain-containing protein n=1 Tax=Chitinibacter sp. SCUT-21 TaxID=2970891 RepID=UPI0035A57FB9
MEMNLSRREFLRRAGMLGVAGAAAPLALNLSILGEAVAATTPSDYKALVCVYLAGGSDSHNLLIPYDLSSHSQYASIRQSLAIARDRLSSTALNTPDGSGRQMALAPELLGLKGLYDSGQLGVISNIGPLVVPTSKSQFVNNAVPLPPKLMSHNDQTNVWLSGAAEGAGQGWGGRIGDLYQSNNSNAALSCIMVNGAKVFLSGKQTAAFTIGTGAKPTQLLSGVNARWGNANFRDDLMSLMTQVQSNELSNVYSETCKRGIATSDFLANTYKSVTDPSGFPAGNSLADQLKAVSRMISARTMLGNSRQVFMVSLGGFDLHDDLNADYPELLSKVNDAMLAFYNSLNSMGLANQVTTFTASEFGRSLASNGDGSDHGWGGHHLVMGGAVKGGQIWGRKIEPRVGGPDDIGQGRLIPDFATDQLAWSLAKWFGASDSDRDLILPSMSNFDANTLRIFA